MLDDKRVLDATFDKLHDEIDDALDLNKDAARINANIEKLLSSKTLNRDELESEYIALIVANRETAYIQGFQDGAKLLHTLLSGNAVSRAMETYGNLAINKFEISMVQPSI